MKFIIDSDLHYKNGKIRPDKNDDVRKIIDVCNEEDIKIVLAIGDLTDNGNYTQCNTYINSFVNLIEINTQARIFSCMGNHDDNVPWYYLASKPVSNFIKKIHKKLYYDFVSDNIHMICCSIYPNYKILQWLSLVLKKNECNKVLFFHFNLLGEDSDWWTETEKNAFYEVIKNYSIICLCVGHDHISAVSTWKDIRVVSAAGSEIALCEIDDDYKLYVKYY